MIYCISDIHGEYEKYLRMLDRLRFSDGDTLYALGDVIDRGKDGVRVLRHMLRHPNIVPLIGNHEYMALLCLRFLLQEITEERVERMDADALTMLLDWQRNGGQTTIDGVRALPQEAREELAEYLGEFILYEEVRAGGRDYVLVHAGLDNFSPERPLEDYALHEVIFNTPDYGRVYFPDRYLVSGHRPTRTIPGNPHPDAIYRANRHIAIDCGAAFGGRLGAICLDSGEAYYI